MSFQVDIATTIPMPASTNEYTTVLAHYYRGEIARATGWRDRIDRTTNWAITLIGGMLSVSLSSPVEQHGILLFAMLLLLLFLVIEARRYRFFDVYRVRLRQLERYYFAQVFGAKQTGNAHWASLIAEDLSRPVFLMSFSDAFARRLRRNYIWLFAMLLLAWTIKIAHVPHGADLSIILKSAFEHAALGPFSGRDIVVTVAVLYAILLFQACRPSRWQRERDDGLVHV